MQEALIFNVKAWNEQELNMHFIGLMFGLISFSSTKFNIFAERPIEGKVQDRLLYGEPDGIIASGRRVPKIPFFAFAEYKKKTDPKGDPEAQALAAMLVGQSYNKDLKTPIYGSYVIGNDWYFMVLVENQFYTSFDYSALKDEIFDIYQMLKALKVIIQKRVRM